MQIVFISKKYIIPEKIEKILAFNFPIYNRKEWMNYIKKGYISCNKIVIIKSIFIKENDILFVPTICLTNIYPLKATSIKYNLDIIYEDEFLLVLNKMPNTIIYEGHRFNNNRNINVLDLLKDYTQKKLSKNALNIKPGIIHRLDKETSGIILFSKKTVIYEQIKYLFKQRKIIKEYLTLVNNIPKSSNGMIDISINRDSKIRQKMKVMMKGKRSMTYWILEKKILKMISLIRCRLITGRTHQIRLHMNYMGCPILGDNTYSPYINLKIKKLIPRIMLHSHKIMFIHPIYKKIIKLEAPLHYDFYKLIYNINQKFYNT